MPDSAPRAPAAAQRESLPTILICEDEASLRELVCAVLGPGYRYLEAVDGAEAIDLARAHAPDLVVLDLMLPEVSGFDVLESLRADAELHATPVVVLTAWSHAMAEAEEKGADRFIAKPFEPEELEAAVEELLGRR
jgi:DNA-binding response OmpR family regulator